jgi:hypothetical protein
MVEVNSVAGKVTAQMWDMNDLINCKGELDRGVMNYSYEKNEVTDGIFAAKMNITF